MATRKKTRPELAYIVPELIPFAVEITSINPDSDNVREHPADNILAIQESIERYKQRKPIIVRKKDRIIEAGNGTWFSMLEAGYSHIAAIFVDDDPKEALGYALADNRSSDMSLFNITKLAEELKKFEDPGSVPGMTPEFLKQIEEELARSSDPVIPDPESLEQIDPTLQADRLIEIYCSSADVQEFTPYLQAWNERQSVTINIS